MIALTGATGAIGGLVAHRLAELGHPQRLVVRDASRAPELAGAEVRVIGGYDDADGLRAALEGAGTLLFVSAGEDPDRVALHGTVVQAAADAGVERVVYTSFVGAAPDCEFTFGRDHFHTEEAIRASGMSFTFARDSLYLDYLPLFVGPDDVIRGPAGTGHFAPVARADVAAALVAMLTDDGHAGATYDLTGRDRITMAEGADLLTSASGRTIAYVDETKDIARDSRAPSGAPEWEIEGWITSYSAIAVGELDVVSADVAILTGREPTGVAEFLQRHYAAA